MPKIKQKSISTKKLIVGLIVVLTICTAGVMLIRDQSAQINQNSYDPVDTVAESDDIDYSAPTEESRNARDDEKTNISDTQPEASPVASSEVVIISAKQELSNIVVMTKLTGASWKHCELSISLDGQVVVKESDTLYQQSFSTCLGFDVGLEEFSASGKWQVELTASKSDGTTLVSEQVSLDIVR
jgi:hypothetical protein